MSQQFVVKSVSIIVRTSLGDFWLENGKWIDPENKPAPAELIPHLEQAFKQQSERAPVKVPVDKGDSL